MIACAVRLLDLGFFRIGSEEYADENGRYGLATLEKRHVRLLPDDRLIFDYVAKSGKRRLQGIVDPLVYETAAELKRRRAGGPAFLAYREGRWVNVRSGEINVFIKELAGPTSPRRTSAPGTQPCSPRWASVSRRTRPRRRHANGRSRVPFRRSRSTSATPPPSAGRHTSILASSTVSRRAHDRRGTRALERPLDPRRPSTQAPLEDAVLDLLDGKRR